MRNPEASGAIAAACCPRLLVRDPTPIGPLPRPAAAGGGTSRILIQCSHKD